MEVGVGSGSDSNKYCTLTCMYTATIKASARNSGSINSSTKKTVALKAEALLKEI